MIDAQAPLAESQVRELTKQIAFAMRLADAPFTEAQVVTLYQYLLVRFGEQDE